MHAQKHYWEPPRLYAWSIQISPGGTGATGVTDDPDRAMAHLHEELEGAPDGAWGVVRRAIPDFSGCYDYGCLLAAGHVDPTTHIVAWWTSAHEKTR